MYLSHNKVSYPRGREVFFTPASFFPSSLFSRLTSATRLNSVFQHSWSASLTSSFFFTNLLKPGPLLRQRYPLGGGSRRRGRTSSFISASYGGTCGPASADVLNPFNHGNNPIHHWMNGGAPHRHLVFGFRTLESSRRFYF